MAKYVVSTTLEDPEWDGTTILRGPRDDDIRALKSAEGALVAADSTVSRACASGAHAPGSTACTGTLPIISSMDLPKLCLGGNVFGWTADRRASFAVLDAAVEAGISFIDSADVYSAWAHDGVGGQSEALLGEWMGERGNRVEVVLATKVGMLPGTEGIRPDTIRRALDASLRRLGTDRIDLYYAHGDDGGDLIESLATFDALVRDGKVAAIGLSNFDADRLAEALEVCRSEGFAAPAAIQPKYSLMERDYEDTELPVAAAAGLDVVPHSALASGFLTGKYRPGGDSSASPRADGARAYLDDPRGSAVLAALDGAAEAHDVPVASVALAWLRAQPTIAAPIASATSVEQVAPLAASIGLELTPAELAALDQASSPARNGGSSA